jgi:hypothetical protein
MNSQKEKSEDSRFPYTYKKIKISHVHEQYIVRKYNENTVPSIISIKI